MTRLRRSRIGRFAASLAGLAFAVQLLVASWGLAFLPPADPADPLGEHALCLAGTIDGKTAPASGQPAPAHGHDGLCCLAHLPPLLQPSSATPAAPVVYAEAAAATPAAAVALPGPHRRLANARAPPPIG